MKEDGIDSKHSMTTDLSVYSANSFSSGVRLEVFGLFDSVIKIDENTTHLSLKLNETTLIALRSVLNSWHQDMIVNRGKK